MKAEKRKRRYSPALKSELIERLYRERKRRRVPMTKLVNRIVEKALPEWETEVLPEIQGTGKNGTRHWQGGEGKQEEE
jgi:hypothetical protein